MALQRSSRSFEILDVGYDLEPENDADIAELAAGDPTEWDRQLVDRLFPEIPVTTGGVERRLSFGSDFPYRAPAALTLELQDCALEHSHSFGGFGNVWGAAVLPYPDIALSEWPVPVESMRRAYTNVARYVPISGEADDLETEFPGNPKKYSALNQSEQASHLMNSLDKCRSRLNRHGIQFGRARVAVDASNSATGCRYCGRCLEGCVYGSIFSPRPYFAELEKNGVRIHGGFYAFELKEQESQVEILAMDVRDQSIHCWRATRVFLAAGQLATTRLLARSLGLHDMPIPILDSQYFFFPIFSYRRPASAGKFTLAEAFLEIRNADISRNHVHLQVYGKNSLFEKLFHNLVRIPAVASAMVDRCYLMQGFMHSEDSGRLEFRLATSSGPNDHVIVKGIPNNDTARVARRVAALVRRSLAGFGVVPPFGVKIVPPGRSFHTGGSFPMGGRHPVLSSDPLGRPAGLGRVHITDSAAFPAIAGSTIVMTIMANADRIATDQAAMDPC